MELMYFLYMPAPDILLKGRAVLLTSDSGVNLLKGRAVLLTSAVVLTAPDLFFILMCNFCTLFLDKIHIL